jgi:zinc D-Ala-D-Ala carboxypeptidase
MNSAMKWLKRPRKSSPGWFIAIMLMTVPYHFALMTYTQNQMNAYQDQISSTFIEYTNNYAKSYFEFIKKLPVYIEIPGSSSFRAIAQDYSADNSLWKLVNKTNSLSDGYTPSDLIDIPVGTLGNAKYISAVMSEDLIEMVATAKSQGVTLTIGSAYRAYDYQKNLYDSSIANIGLPLTSIVIAEPGHSEYQTGLAVDVSSTPSECFIELCFAETSSGLWLSQNAHNFGFALRYPKGKESITGYMYEPWHYRYVGRELATAIFESELTLEEAYPYLETALSTLKSQKTIE